MKAYRKPSGVYIELDDNTPVSASLVQCAPRPSVNHVFSVNWQSDPMNPSVCWVFDLTAYKKDKSSRMIYSYESAMKGGFESSALGATHRYDSSESSQIKLAGAVAIGLDGVYECTEVASGNAVYPMHTAAQLKQVLIDGATLARTYKQRLRDKLAQVRAASTKEAVDAIGW